MTIRLHFFAFSSDSPSIRWRANAIHPPCRLYNGIYGYIIIYTYTCCVLPSSQLSLRYCCCCCSSSAQFDNDYDCFGDFPNRGQWRADFLTWATPPLLFCPLAQSIHNDLFIPRWTNGWRLRFLWLYILAMYNYSSCTRNRPGHESTLPRYCHLSSGLSYRSTTC